jgi:hypothetical protein
MQELLRVLKGLEPEEALAALAGAMGTLFAHVSEEARLKILLGLVGGAGDDQVASMVHR